eukprot:3871979-Pleurochrysis_carterae.AAC.4
MLRMLPRAWGRLRPQLGCLHGAIAAPRPERSQSKQPLKRQVQQDGRTTRPPAREQQQSTECGPAAATSAVAGARSIASTEARASVKTDGTKRSPREGAAAGDEAATAESKVKAAKATTARALAVAAAASAPTVAPSRAPTTSLATSASKRTGSAVFIKEAVEAWEDVDSSAANTRRDGKKPASRRQGGSSLGREKRVRYDMYDAEYDRGRVRKVKAKAE